MSWFAEVQVEEYVYIFSSLAASLMASSIRRRCSQPSFLWHCWGKYMSLYSILMSFLGRQKDAIHSHFSLGIDKIDKEAPATDFLQVKKKTHCFFDSMPNTSYILKQFNLRTPVDFKYSWVWEKTPGLFLKWYNKSPINDYRSPLLYKYSSRKQTWFFSCNPRRNRLYFSTIAHVL